MEATHSMNKKQSDLLEKDLKNAIQDVKTLESTAISLDGVLTKAQYHLKSGSSEQRTSCRTTADRSVYTTIKFWKCVGSDNHFSLSHL